MAIYTEEINARAASPRFAGEVAGADAIGTAASMYCGSFVRYFLAIDHESLVITDIKFRSNGCGYAVAAAELLAEKMSGKPLTDLAGFQIGDAIGSIEREFGEYPAGRQQCAEMCFDAFRDGLNMFRASRLDDFGGESALICTCFGVDEAAIERAITQSGVETISDVAAMTSAGAGCGSCRMLIQTMIDSQSV